MKYLKINIILILVVLGLFMFIFFFNRSSPPDSFDVSQNPIQTPISQSFVTPENIMLAQQSLKNKETIYLSEYSSFEVINIEQLSEDIRFLISFEPKNISVEKLNFVNGDSGFKISYSIDMNIFDYYIDFLNTKINGGNNKYGWQKVMAVRADLVALIELENENYKAKIEQTYVDDSHSQVSITVIK